MEDETPPASPTRIRLTDVISEVALAADGETPRPIHILRTGTFTGQSGRAVTFEPSDIAAIVANFAAGARSRPPITERHDWGRAVGRMAEVWADQDNTNLYALPAWNSAGRALLTEEVYDGFSSELDVNEHGYFLIGGSLTNYPAVDGLQPVSLSLPAIDAPASPPPQEDITMSDTPELIALDLPQGIDAGLQSRIETYVSAQQEATLRAQEAAFQRMQAEFDRKIKEQEQRAVIAQFARSKTMASIGQPWALPCTPDELTALLSETPQAQRVKWMQLLNRITTSGLLTFDEVGSSAEGAELADQWSALVAANEHAGMSRVEAIQAAGRAHPQLYAQQTRVKKGGR